LNRLQTHDCSNPPWGRFLPLPGPAHTLRGGHVEARRAEYQPLSGPACDEVN
jgi:hypothetical protein